jgi:hypothetical protein
MKLISKTIVGKRKVYDLKVKDNHNYMITKSDIIVHNSGKGFVLDNLIGVEGRVFDVDKLKILSAMVPSIINKVKSEMDIDLTKLDIRKNKLALKDPENVSLLHEIIGDKLNIPNKAEKAFFASVLSSDPDRKPNIIFDVTLKDLQKLKNITRSVLSLKYDLKNIHIVWILNDIQVALSQNEIRDRTVPREILINTHRGVSFTMKDIISLGEDLKKYMDGDIVFAFNQINVDSTLARSEIPDDLKGKFKISSKETGGKYIIDADYFYVKRSGRPVTSLENLSLDVRRKINSYVPKETSWVD